MRIGGMIQGLNYSAIQIRLENNWPRMLNWRMDTLIDENELKLAMSQELCNLNKDPRPFSGG